MIVRFLDCVTDGAARSLLRNGAALHLTPKSFDVLWLLVSERPRVVGKAEILDRVWPGTFVTDASLTRTIHEIREALGDDVGPAAIRTVHGRGYAFRAEAGHVEPKPATVSPMEPVRAWLLVGTRAIALRDGEATIGRDPTVAAPLEALLASWHHARVHVAGALVTIEDLGSKNGTEVRGQRVATVTRLQDGDDILIGATRIVFRLGEKVHATATDVLR